MWLLLLWRRGVASVDSPGQNFDWLIWAHVNSVFDVVFNVKHVSMR